MSQCFDIENDLSKWSIFQKDHNTVRRQANRGSFFIIIGIISGDTTKEQKIRILKEKKENVSQIKKKKDVVKISGRNC